MLTRSPPVVSLLYHFRRIVTFRGRPCTLPTFSVWLLCFSMYIRHASTSQRDLRSSWRKVYSIHAHAMVLPSFWTPQSPLATIFVLGSSCNHTLGAGSAGNKVSQCSFTSECLCFPLHTWRTAVLGAGVWAQGAHSSSAWMDSPPSATSWAQHRWQKGQSGVHQQEVVGESTRGTLPR